MSSQILESETGFSAIEQKIGELKDRQESRMRADDRLASDVVDNFVLGSNVANTGELLISNANSYIDIVVNEDGTQTETTIER